MKITLSNGLPCVSVALINQQKEITLGQVLVDTGSAGTIFSADKVITIGLHLEAADKVHRIRGVGGTEFVFIKRIDSIRLGEFVLKDFEVEIGGMDYGFNINGILGMDFLPRSNSMINLKDMDISFR